MGTGLIRTTPLSESQRAGCAIAGSTIGIQVEPTVTSAEMEAPIDKEGAEFFLNQNSREPVTEPDEMVPLWKILHLAGASWTYGSRGWAGENYCLFLADSDGWRQIIQNATDQTHALGCKTYLNTE